LLSSSEHTLEYWL